MKYDNLRPKYRSTLRSYLGKAYYTYKRYLDWYLGGETYARIHKDLVHDHLVTQHKTPLYRQLKNVDMWLQENKVENLKIALKEIDGVTILPGETFSYWKMIGKPTYAKGYKDGMVLHYGKFKSGPGGGLCQLSNMIYWMALHTPLTVTERHRHSFDVFPDASRTQPFGSGATCVYNYRDLKMKNETNEGYQMKLWIDGKYLNGAIYSDKDPYFQYRIYEAHHAIYHQHWGAYVRTNELRRSVSNMSGDVLVNELVCENKALMMYDPLIESNDGKN